mmetsp:Transcript_73313/g.137015  ORF Transcript_73313/g.137015 Transcript_73313/m.137015 type:complete len:96 (+) Transcript_73313:61-348(+)
MVLIFLQTCTGMTEQPSGCSTLCALNVSSHMLFPMPTCGKSRASTDLHGRPFACRAEVNSHLASALHWVVVTSGSAPWPASATRTRTEVTEVDDG